VKVNRSVLIGRKGIALRALRVLSACGWLWACGNDPQPPEQGSPVVSGAEAGQTPGGSSPAAGCTAPRCSTTPVASNVDASGPGVGTVAPGPAAGEAGSAADTGTSASDAGSDAATIGTGGSGSADRDGSTDASSSGRPDVGAPDSSMPTDPDRCDVAVLDTAKPPRALTLSGDLGVHDPTLIAAHGQYYLFSTGLENTGGLLAKTSTDLITWRDAPAPLIPHPAWVAQRVAAVRNLWAPDISYFGSIYHLYYSASSFGSRNSCIGHASRPALNSGSWQDHGAVICSRDQDDWNAIDPNVIVDQAGTPWLAFGSFWSGIKAIQLNQNGARADDKLHALAKREPKDDGAVEAPVIVRRCGYYYMFVSFDKCCVGAASTYNIRVGRSQNVLGPYVDVKGVAMTAGGGTPLVAGDGRFAGAGHNTVLFRGTQAFNVYHAYSIQQNGRAVLRISELFWNDAAWPVSGGP
jgi:arabinan endo-1,5-alpha-L-arabinosidase